MDNWSIVACKSLFLERVLRGIWEAWAWNLDDFWFWTMQATCDLQSCIWYKFGLVICFHIVLQTFGSVNCATKLSLDGTNCIWKYFWTCKYFFEFLWWHYWTSVSHKKFFCGLWLNRETLSVVRKPYMTKFGRKTEAFVSNLGENMKILELKTVFFDVTRAHSNRL